MDTHDIFAGLNAPQTEAVLATEGFVRVIAGAGSGKTRALTARYAHLVQELGVSPANILCMTFTNKASREMRRRLRRMLGDGIDTSFVSTFHSFCVRILREDIGRLFYPESFVVLDTADQKSILEEVYEELGIKMDTATFEFMIEQIKFEKNLGEYMQYMAVPGNEIRTVKPADLRQQVIFRYMEKQKKYFGLDFFDLVNFTAYLFRTHSDILEKWQNRIHYVMVDEFQDITAKEFKMIRWLAAINQNFFVVGDPDQNIYEWRGSRMEVLLDFENNIRCYFHADAEPSMWTTGYAEANRPLTGSFQTIFLNQNYRSTPEIVNASNCLIAKNQNRLEKALFTQNPNGAAVIHRHAKNDAEEIDFIAEAIQSHVKQGGKFSDCAVLYRSNYVSRFIEQGFLRRSIPYIVYGGTGFYERREIKDVLSYLRLAAHGDDLSFQRIVNIPRRKMGKTKLSFLRQKAAEEETTLYEALKTHIRDPIFSGTGARNFLQVLENAKTLSEAAPVSELLQTLLIDSGYEDYIRESGEMDRLDNVAELLRSIVTQEEEYGETLTLAAFLQDASLGREDDADDGKDCVKIMTAHIAKGLEFHTVFLAGLSEKIFPSARALEERREQALEEERRLCYVAMTRAQQRLYLTESEGFGVKGYVKTPSRFLFDIDDDCITRIGAISDELMDEHRLQTVLRSPYRTPPYAVGTAVKHKYFGEGVVESVDHKTSSYQIRFLIGIKPIRFDFPNLWRIE